MRYIPKIAAAIAILASASAVDAKMSIPAPTYVAKAGASDLFERRSAALMTRSQNPSVRDFAEMMVSDHTKSSATVKSAAMKARMRVASPALSSKQSRDLAALGAARGVARDRLYIDQQKIAHRDALILQQDYADNGSVQPLRIAASSIVPVVKHHIEMLDAM